MRRKKAFKRGHVLSILVAAGIGYLLGNWNASALHGQQSSPAQAVAMRFPQNFDPDSAPSAAPPLAHRRAAVATAAMIGDPLAAVFDPQPMLPRPAPPQPQPLVHLASAEAGNPIPQVVAAPPVPPVAPLAAASERRPKEPAAARVKPTIPAVARRPEHRGYMLDDAQIAGIKARLRLTPDQERMWPAVATALHNIGFARMREARYRTVESVDPNSAEVQNLKYAAIPLLMSFDEEQKGEVRNLAHNMGLDQLASQF